jgi:CubicO group peptidase (beta-lactamase class C family)
VRAIVCGVVLAIAVAAVATAAARPAWPPAAAVQHAAPDFSEARRIAAGLPRLYSLTVSHRGATVFEYYARGRSATRAANVKSASKSIISALTGIAIERGLITGVEQPLAAFFPELNKDADLRKRAITVEHLLTMRTGLESTSGRNYGRWVTSRNWVAHALARPMVTNPGTAMQYSTGTSHILSALLTRVSKTSTWQFAQSALGKPLGIQIARWPQDPQGIYFGGNDMLLTPRQMVAFGELYLQRGRVNGQQIVPAAWVDTSCVPRTSSRFDPGREYGYGWWIDEVGGHTACYAWGYGGQFILVFRELDLVVAVTSSTADSDERRGYRREVLTLVGDIADRLSSP